MSSFSNNEAFLAFTSLHFSYLTQREGFPLNLCQIATVATFQIIRELSDYFLLTNKGKFWIFYKKGPAAAGFLMVNYQTACFFTVSDYSKKLTSQPPEAGLLLAAAGKPSTTRNSTLLLRCLLSWSRLVESGFSSPHATVSRCSGATPRLTR